MKMQRIKASLVAFTAVACALPNVATAKTTYLSGVVTSATDTLGVLGGIDILGKTFMGSVSFSDDPACGPFHLCLHQIGPATFGTLLFNFGGLNADMFSLSYPRTLYMRPFSGATIQGPGIDFYGKADGVFTLLADGTATWGFGIGTGYSWQGGSLRVSGTAHEVALVPEPQTYAMLLAGLAGLGMLLRRRRPA